MANNCWYCRKGGIVDLYFAGRTGVCPICRSGVNVQFDVGRFVALDNITTKVDEWVKGMGGSEPNEPLTMAQLKALPDGTKVYCYKLVKGKLEPDEWEVCRTKKGTAIKRSNGGYHWVNQIAIDGNGNWNNRRCYLKEVDLNGGNSGSGSQLKYKIGDHVIVEEDNIGGHYAGKTGVISDIWPNPHNFPYRVDFDNEPGLSIWCKVKCLVEEEWEEEILF